MADSDEDDQVLADFLESEMLSGVPDQEVEDAEGPSEINRVSKRPRLDEESSQHQGGTRTVGGIFFKIPPELFHHILKYLSSEDLIACSLVCRFMNSSASDDRLWRRLYCMRWGVSSPAGKLRACAWKKLYIQRDQEDMVEFVKNTPQEFKEYYIQMQAAKRSQVPLPSQVNDDRVILDRTVADQVSLWRSSRGFTDESVTDHACSGRTCSYSQIGDAFLCEKTGRVHVCDDTCREVVLDQASGVMVTKQSLSWDQDVLPELIYPYRNQGGFDMICSGRDKIETPEQFKQAEDTANKLDFDGLVVIGGENSAASSSLSALGGLGAIIFCGTPGGTSSVWLNARTNFAAPK